jgi:hypothetical protein
VYLYFRGRWPEVFTVEDLLCGQFARQHAAWRLGLCPAGGSQKERGKKEKGF